MRQSLYHISKEEVESYWWTLFLRCYDWLSEIPDFGIASGKISWVHGISKLESQLKIWSMFKISISSFHNALDQRSCDSKINLRTFDIVIDCGAKRFSRLRYAWCDDCVCIEKTSRQACSFPHKSKCRRAACSKIRPILTMETNCLHDLRAFPCNRSLWSGRRTLRFVQYTFAERRRPRFRRPMGSSFIISKRHAFSCDPGRIVQVKNSRLCSASDCLGFVRSRNRSKQWTDKFFAIVDVCKTSYWSDDENSILHTPERSCGKRSSNQEFKRKESPCWEESGSVFSGKHLDSVRKETHEVSVMTNQYKETLTVVRDEKDDRLLPHQKSKAKTDEGREKPWKHQAREREALQTKGAKFRVDVKIVKTRRVCFGIFPCVNTSSLRPDANLEEHVSSDMLRLMRSPARSQRKVVRKDQLFFWRSLHNCVVYLKILIREKSILRKERKLGSNHAVKFSQITWHQHKIWERKVPSRGIIQKCAPHVRSLCAPQFEERTHEETLQQDGCARKAAWDLAKLFYKLKNADKASFYTLIEARVIPAPTSKKTRGARIRCRFKSINEHDEQKKWSSDELDTFRRSRNPTVAYSQWRSANKRGSTSIKWKTLRRPCIFL